MAGDFERPPPNGKPAKLPRSEPEAGVTIGLHHECPAVTTLLADLRNRVWPAQYEQRLDDTHVEQQADPEDGQPYPQSPLPRVAEVITPTDHMNDPRDNCDDRQQDVGGM